MSDKLLTRSATQLVSAMFVFIAASGVATAGIDGSDALGIDGSDALGIDGSDALGIDGSDALGIDGSDALGIDGSDALGIDGSDALGIDGSDALGIDGSGLLVLGAIDYVGDGFISVLGQTVFGDLGSLAAGMTVAVYGSLDSDTGGILEARVFPMGSSKGGASFLRGFVDEVDLALGLAVISGITVDYNALLSNGSAPRVGDQVSVIGRSYNKRGLLVADPSLGLD
jgi:hypothetical protein